MKNFNESLMGIANGFCNFFRFRQILRLAWILFVFCRGLKDWLPFFIIKKEQGRLRKFKENSKIEKNRKSWKWRFWALSIGRRDFNENLIGIANGFCKIFRFRQILRLACILCDFEGLSAFASYTDRKVDCEKIRIWEKM